MMGPQVGCYRRGMNHRKAVRSPTSSGSGARQVTLEQLRTRGWTRREVEDWLGEPDRWLPRPSWAAERVAAAGLERDRGQAAPIGAESGRPGSEPGRPVRWARSASARRRRERQLTCLQAEMTPLELGQIEHQVLLELTRWRWVLEVGTPFPEEDIARLAANLLRHLHSDYELLMVQIAGRQGERDAYAIAWRRLMTEVSLHFPELADEFSRQGRARLEPARRRAA